MRKVVLLSLLSLLVHQTSMAQQATAEEIQKRLDQALKDPQIKAMYEQARNAGKQPSKASNTDSLKKLVSKGGQTRMTAEPEKDSSHFSPPPRNEKYLQALPLRVFNRNELVSYLHNLNSTFAVLLHSDFGVDIENIPVSSAAEACQTSIALWLDNQQEQSALLILKAAEMEPDNSILLNNTGGILTNGGLGVNAIPILQYILAKDPTNNTILNNIGQAYLSLGDTKTAENYLLQCVKDSRYHPDANLGLAFIMNGRGNKAEAIRYAENSLRGAFSVPAYNILTKLKPDAKLMDYIRHRYTQPEYFNFDKYPLLPQCRDVQNAPILKAQYAAYKKMLIAAEQKYFKLAREENEIEKKTVAEKIQNTLKQNKTPFRPFGLFAGVVVTDLVNNEYHDRFRRFAEYKKNYLAQRGKLDTNYLAEINAINAKYKLQKEDVAERDGEGNDGTEYDALRATICAEKEVVKNRYLNLYADVIEAYQQQAIHLYKDYFNDMAFWNYVASINDDQYKMIFHDLVYQFLRVLEEINTTRFYTPCRVSDNKADKVKELTIEDPECYLPTTLKIPMGIANVEINCNEYKIEGGEGLIFNLKHNRLNGETTLAFGPGVKVPDMPKFSAGGLEIETSAKVSGQAFIKFDNDGAPLDWGLIYTGKIDVKAKAFGMGKSISDNETVIIGVNSGVNIRDGGVFKNMIDKMYPVQPEAKQINKNVPLYKK